MILVREKRWRRVLVADLLLYNVATFFLGLLPPVSLNRFELVALAATAFAGIGLVSHASDRFSLPGEHFSYLITGAVGMYVLLAYAGLSVAPLDTKIPFLLFLASGVVSALAGHIIDGHKRGVPHDGDG